MPRAGTIAPEPAPIAQSPQLPRLLHGEPPAGERRSTKGRRRPPDAPLRERQAEVVAAMKVRAGLADNPTIAPPAAPQALVIDLDGAAAIVCRSFRGAFSMAAATRVLRKAIELGTLKIRLDAMISVDPPRFRRPDLEEWVEEAAMWLASEMPKAALAPVTLDQILADHIGRLDAAGQPVTEAALIAEARRCGLSPGRAEIRRLRAEISPGTRGRPAKAAKKATGAADR
jgi:hypothetical protein